MSPHQFTSRKVPRSALQFAAEITPGNGESSEGSDGATLYPFTMTARTGGVADHMWWGRCVHDFAGMKPPRPQITIDYAHDPGDVIGFADGQEVRDNNLMLSGSLVSMGNDRAFEVHTKRNAGVPYQASILMNPEGLVIENVSRGMVATANGQQFEGPVTIFREWELWGCAVCPYGSDGSTGIEFSAGDAGEVEVRVITSASAPVVQPVTKSGRDYMARFGEKHGALWFAQGIPFDQCVELWQAVLQDEKSAKEREREEIHAQLVELQKKYDALVKEHDREKAENAAFKFGMDSLPPNIHRAELVRQPFSNLSTGLAAFAASIRLPIDPTTPR